MERRQFKIDINAGVSKVYDTMLGEETYKQWTAVFNPSSHYEGSWNKDEKIFFVGTSKQGKKEGMIGMIKENIPNKFVSIEYLGLLDGDNEITEGPLVEGWAGAFENYSFSEAGGVTSLVVDIDVNKEMEDYFLATYPKSLEKLKEICEA